MSLNSIFTESEMHRWMNSLNVSINGTAVNIQNINHTMNLDHTMPLEEGEETRLGDDYSSFANEKVSLQKEYLKPLMKDNFMSIEIEGERVFVDSNPEDVQFTQEFVVHNENDYEQACNEDWSSEWLSVHWIEGKEIIRSRGNMNLIRECIVEEPCGEEIFSSGKINILSAPAGYGKSSSIFQASKKDEFGLIVKFENVPRWNSTLDPLSNLKTLGRALGLSKYSCKKLDFADGDLFLNASEGYLGDLNVKLFINMYNRGLISLYIEDFDTLNTSNQDRAMMWVAALELTKIKKIWITTRPSTCEKLEFGMGKLAHKINALPESKGDQMLLDYTYHRYPNLTKSLEVDEKIMEYARMFKTYTKAWFNNPRNIMIFVNNLAFFEDDFNWVDLIDNYIMEIVKTCSRRQKSEEENELNGWNLYSLYGVAAIMGISNDVFEVFERGTFAKYVNWSLSGSDFLGLTYVSDNVYFYEPFIGDYFIAKMLNSNIINQTFAEKFYEIVKNNPMSRANLMIKCKNKV